MGFCHVEKCSSLPGEVGGSTGLLWTLNMPLNATSQEWMLVVLGKILLYWPKPCFIFLTLLSSSFHYNMLVTYKRHIPGLRWGYTEHLAVEKLKKNWAEIYSFFSHFILCSEENVGMPWIINFFPSRVFYVWSLGHTHTHSHVCINLWH